MPTFLDSGNSSKLLFSSQLVVELTARWGGCFRHRKINLKETTSKESLVEVPDKPEHKYPISCMLFPRQLIVHESVTRFEWLNRKVSSIVSHMRKMMVLERSQTCSDFENTS